MPVMGLRTGHFWPGQSGKRLRSACGTSHIPQTAQLDAHPYISFEIRAKPEAENAGGVNIFGEKYGDYPQGICMRIVY